MIGMIKKIISYVALSLLMLSSFAATAEDFLPDTDGKYSISYQGDVLEEYVITAIKGVYDTEEDALDALFAAQDADVVFYDSKKADTNGTVLFDAVIPITYTDASVFISGAGLEKPVYIGTLLSNGNTDIAKAVFVGIEDCYTVKGKGSPEITETITAYTVDSFGYPSLSNPSLSIELENGDEYVWLSPEGILYISPVAEEKTYTLKATLENGFSDSFSFTVLREPARAYEVFVFRADAHDRPMESFSIVGTDGIYPAFEVYAKTYDQFGQPINDEYTFIVDKVEYPDGFTPSAEGVYDVYVASKSDTNVTARVVLTVTNRPAYQGNAALLYEALLTAQKEADRINYDVFISDENGRDIFPDKFWTTTDAFSALTDAANNADKYLLMYENEVYSEEKYLSEYNIMNAAIEKYRLSVKNGIRKDATEISIDISPSPEAKIPVINGIINLQPGNARKNYVVLTASMFPYDHTEKVIWSSSNPEILSISESGQFSVKVSGTSVGKASVTATTRTGLTCSYEFNIFRPFTNILMSKNASMILGQEPHALTYTLSPENSGDVLTWTSSNENVATVDNSGVVTAKGIGKAIITATGIMGKTGTTTMTVGLPADTIALGENASDTINMQTLSTFSIGAFASRHDGQIPLSTEVSYKIIDMVAQSPSYSKRDVITLSETGHITAKYGGTAIIRISAVSSLDKVYRDIRVNVFSPAQNITLSSLRKTIPVGDTLQLDFDIRPDDTTDNVTWYSSRPGVATVDKSGLVTAHSEGTARIYAVADSGITKYCTVSTGYGPDLVKITSRALSVEAGSIAFIRAKAVRENGATCIDSSVSYDVVSGKKHIKINDYGVVTGVSAGTAEILIYSNMDPSVSKKISITVCEKITEISFTKKVQKMYKGQLLDFATLIKALPETHTDIISWESSNTGVISVDEHGTVTCVSVGKARVYAYAGGVSAYIDVDVVEGADSIEITTPKTNILSYGDSMVLSAKALDKNGEILTSGVTWESSDTRILTISPDGTIKANSIPGTVTITARAVAGDVYDSVSFTIIPALYQAELQENSITLESGQSLDILSILTLYDVNKNLVDTHDCTFALRSRDTRVASADGTLIYALSPGSTSVRIIIYCGKVSRNLNVTVTVTQAENNEQPGELTADLQNEESDPQPSAISNPTPVALESI